MGQVGCLHAGAGRLGSGWAKRILINNVYVCMCVCVSKWVVCVACLKKGQLGVAELDGARRCRFLKGGDWAREC